MQRLSLVTAASLALACLANGCEAQSCEDGCGDDHADHGEESDTDTGTEESLSEQFCECMLANCHETYHSTWGEEHISALMMCHAHADAVPEAGMEAMSGDFIECRLHFCEAAASEPGLDDAENCPRAMGQDVCM